MMPNKNHEGKRLPTPPANELRPLTGSEYKRSVSMMQTFPSYEAYLKFISKWVEVNEFFDEWNQTEKIQPHEPVIKIGREVTRKDE